MYKECENCQCRDCKLRFCQNGAMDNPCNVCEGRALPMTNCSHVELYNQIKDSIVSNPKSDLSNHVVNFNVSLDYVCDVLEREGIDYRELKKQNFAKSAALELLGIIDKVKHAYEENEKELACLNDAEKDFLHMAEIKELDSIQNGIHVKEKLFAKAKYNVRVLDDLWERLGGE